jgi:prepilin-type N-terminal cleavage/methylation domain-containing protein
MKPRSRLVLAKNRLGYTLLEMLVVMVVGTVAMNAMYPWLIELLEEGESLTAELTTGVSIQDMVSRLRSDARNASEIQTNSPKIIFLLADQGRVEWDFSEGDIRRVAFNDKSSRMQDIFRFPCQLGLSVEQATSPERLSMSLDIPYCSGVVAESFSLPATYRLPIELTVGRIGEGISE